MLELRMSSSMAVALFLCCLIMAFVGLVTLWNSPVDHELLKGL